MVKPKIHVFIPEIYPRRLFIVKGVVSEKWLNERFFLATSDEKIEPIHKDCKACVYKDIVEYKPDGKYGVLICIKDGRLGVDSIAHESVYAAACIFDEIGAYFDFENQEPFTYLVGWIADCINQVVTNKFKD